MKYLLLIFFPILSFSQQIDKVDFIKCTALVQPNFDSKSVNGSVNYEFKVKSEIDSIRIDAKNMEFSNVTIDGKSVKFLNNKKELVLFEGYKKGKNKLTFSYTVTPKQTIYFTGIGQGQQIWTQGQGKYTSFWLPSFDDVNEKVIFCISINYDKNFKVIANGLFKNANTKANGQINKNNYTWNFEMQKPMASYLVMLAIGDFLHKTEISKSGIPLENYYKPVDEDKYQFTYKDSKTIFDFLEKQIGVKYPWKVYRQIPVEDFLYAGMENTSSTIFSQDFVVDESGYNDRNYFNVNAHELAHQWFGDMVTAKSGNHHWLQEGFATYYALLAERHVFGDDYFYNQLFSYANRIKVAAKTDTIPVMNEKASSLSFYQKGAWALHTIREKIGAKKFDKAVKSYLKKYQYKNVETDDFLAEIRKVSDFDTEEFKKVWLEDYKYPANDINFLLTKNGFMRDLLKLQSERKTVLKEKYNLLKTVLSSDGYFPLKNEVIYQIRNETFDKVSELYDIAVNSNDVQIRKAVAQNFTTVPKSFKTTYESFLNDTSNTTKETAFVNLCKSFPEDKANYFEIVKNWQPTNDKGIRIVFLYMNLIDKNIDSTTNEAYWNEFLEYTSPKYESTIRQNALEYGLQIDSKNEILLKNLVNATVHHKWQFTKYARDTIREICKDKSNVAFFTNLLPSLPTDEQVQLKRLLP